VRVSKVTTFLSFKIVSYLGKLHLFVLYIFCEDLNFFLSSGPVVFILGFCIILFLVEFEVLLVLVREVALDFVHLLAHFIVLLFYLEEVLDGVVSDLFRLSFEVLAVHRIGVEHGLRS
jgi:hypothetical protein